MDLETLLKSPPPLHKTGSELTSHWKLADAELRFLDRTLQPGMTTIETGAGLSTILFAIKGADHTAIVPDSGLVDRITSWCRNKSIDAGRLHFEVEPSQTALPRLLGSDKRYDVALIDGSHIFPLPFLDWYYISRLLKTGGVLIVDDLHIWTCETLVRFLARDPSWQIVGESASGAIFRKLKEDKITVEWKAQPFVADQSRETSISGKVRYANTLVRRGKFRLLASLMLGRLSWPPLGNRQRR